MTANAAPDAGPGRLVRSALWIRKRQPTITTSAIVIGAVIGYFGDLSFLRPLIPAIVFLIILPVMFGADLKKVAGAFSNPRFLAAILGLNYLVSPLLGMALAQFFFAGHLDYTIGLCLFTLLPTINAISGWIKIADGDINASVVVLSLSLVLSVATIPLGMQLMFGARVTVPFLQIMLTVLNIVILPLLLGVAGRHGVRRLGGAERERLLLEVLPAVSILFLGLLFMAIISQGIRDIAAQPLLALHILAASVTLFVGSLALGVIVARLLKLSYAMAITLILSAACRNVPIGLAVASSFFPGAAIVLIVSFLTQASANGLFSPYYPRLKFLFADASGSPQAPAWRRAGGG